MERLAIGSLRDEFSLLVSVVSETCGQDFFAYIMKSHDNCEVCSKYTKKTAEAIRSMTVPSIQGPKKHISISFLWGYPYLIGLHYKGVYMGYPYPYVLLMCFFGAVSMGPIFLRSSVSQGYGGDGIEVWV